MKNKFVKPLLLVGLFNPVACEDPISETSIDQAITQTKDQAIDQMQDQSVQDFEWQGPMPCDPNHCDFDIIAPMVPPMIIPEDMFKPLDMDHLPPMPPPREDFQIPQDASLQDASLQDMAIPPMPPPREDFEVVPPMPAPIQDFEVFPPMPAPPR